MMKETEKEKTKDEKVKHKDGVMETTKEFCKTTGKLLKKTVKDTEKAMVKTKDVIFNPLHHNKKKESDTGDNNEVEKEEEENIQIPPDETLQSMDIIVKKTLKGVTVQHFFDVCWKEAKAPLYRPWLESMGNLNVNVGSWEVNQETDDGDSMFVGSWDQERYPMKRIVTFEKPPSVFSSSPIPVKHTQHCRYDDDRCVVSMMVEMQGIPFANSFNVQIRWVATRVGQNNLKIEVGLFVLFSKSVIVASKIRSNTKSSTTEMQSSLLTCMKEACGADDGAESDHGDEDEKEGQEEHKAKGLSSSMFSTISQTLASFLAPFVAALVVEVLKIPSAREAIANVIAQAQDEKIKTKGS